MLILAGDIGGTKTRLQLSSHDNPLKPEYVHRQDYNSSDYATFSDIIKEFLESCKQPSKGLAHACFAIAGPIVDGTVQLTNLPWFIQEAQLHERFGIEKVKLINDFQAIGYGIDALEKKDFHALQNVKKDPHGFRAIIGAGTGLGIALSFWNGHYHEVNPTEGGHVDFAPTDDTQVELLHYLRNKLRRVSAERVVSGIGIANIYKFVRDNPLYNELENPVLKRRFLQEDPAACVTEFAIKHRDPMATRALHHFIVSYGSITGNLALTTLPYGGIYIVGGIAPKLLPQLSDGRFLQAYSNKGRMSPLLKNFPIEIVLNTDVGLMGAAVHATRL